MLKQVLQLLAGMSSGEQAQEDNNLLGPQLRQVLQEHILQHLQAHDLAKLATTCKSLHTLVMAAPASVWQSAAQKSLPWCPCIPGSIPAIQATLTAYETASRHITSQRQPAQRFMEPEIQGCLGECATSPDGGVLACSWGRAGCAGGIVFINREGAQSSQAAFVNGYCPQGISWQADARHLRVMLVGHKLLRFALYDSQSGACISSCNTDIFARHLECFWHDRMSLALVGDPGNFPSAFRFVSIDKCTVIALVAPRAWPNNRQICSVHLAVWSSRCRVAIVCGELSSCRQTLIFFDSTTGGVCTSDSVPEPTHGSAVCWSMEGSSIHGKAKWDGWLTDNSFLVPLEEPDLLVVAGLEVLSLSDGQRQSCNLELAFDAAMAFISDVHFMLPSPDCKQVALLYWRHPFHYNAGGYIVDLQGHTVHEIVHLYDSPTMFDMGRCAWSPCGRFLAHCTSVPSSNRAQLNIVDAREGNVGALLLTVDLSSEFGMRLEDDDNAEAQLELVDWQMVWSASDCTIAVVAWQSHGHGNFRGSSKQVILFDVIDFS